MEEEIGPEIRCGGSERREGCPNPRHPQAKPSSSPGGRLSRGFAVVRTEGGVWPCGGRPGRDPSEEIDALSLSLPPFIT